ncbi:MAG TPA: chemotaxis protein CheX [Gemmatimonadaceae bacterium]|nr:chemotaxis protein CheX [Gemmatimonadaceae bacterium]
MLQPPTTSLLRAATSTFESLALLFAESCSAVGAEFIPLEAAVSVSYHGASSGRVVVGVTTGVLPALAENMLGAAAAPDVRLQHDALGEVANVVTGNVLPLINGASAVFRLEAPAPAGETPFRVLEGEVQGALVRLRMDEGDAILALFTKEVHGAGAGAGKHHPAAAIT